MKFSLKKLLTSPIAPDKEGKENFFIDIIKFIILAAIFVIPFRMYVAEPYIVSGASMFPTFDTGHYLIIDKFTHRIGGLERGDVVVFKYPNDPSKFFIKRIIGLPGETLKIEKKIVSVKKVGATEFTELDEPYTNNKLQSDMEMALDADMYFVMGDNRGNSSDSRIWGPLRKDLIKGEPLLRLYPLDVLATEPGDYDRDTN